MDLLWLILGSIGLLVWGVVLSRDVLKQRQRQRDWNNGCCRTCGVFWERLNGPDSVYHCPRCHKRINP